MKKILFSLMTLIILASCGTNSSVTEIPEVPTDNSMNTIHDSYTPDAQIVSGSVTDDAMVEWVIEGISDANVPGDGIESATGVEF